MNDKRFFAIILGLCAFSGAHAAGSFFGITLGAPFAVRECGLDDYGLSDRPLDVCSRSADAAHHPWGAITHSVQFVGSYSSIGIKTIFVKEFNGRVVNIGAATFGESAQNRLLADLTRKFGPPTSSHGSLKQNGYGAKFLSLHATWKKPGYTVTFDGLAGSRDAGEIDISDPEAALEERAANEWRASKRKAGATM